VNPLSLFSFFLVFPHSSLSIFVYVPAPIQPSSPYCATFAVPYVYPLSGCFSPFFSSPFRSEVYSRLSATVQFPSSPPFLLLLFGSPFPSRQRLPSCSPYSFGHLPLMPFPFTDPYPFLVSLDKSPIIFFSLLCEHHFSSLFLYSPFTLRLNLIRFFFLFPQIWSMVHIVFPRARL